MDYEDAVSEEDIVQESYYDFPYHHVAQYSPHFSQNYNDGWGINYVSTLEFLLKKIESGNTFRRIIDFGCGDGRLTKEIRLRFPDAQVDGVDYSERAVRYARAFDPQGKFQVKDLTRSDPEENMYDVGVLVEVFEHVSPDDEAKFLNYICGSLKQGGVLHITVPHANTPVQEHHHRHFTRNDMCKIWGNSFSISEVVFFDKISRKKDIIDKVLQNNFFILNHRRILDWIYKYYKENLFIANEKNCNRMYIKAKKI